MQEQPPGTPTRAMPVIHRTVESGVTGDYTADRAGEGVAARERLLAATSSGRGGPPHRRGIAHVRVIEGLLSGMPVSAIPAEDHVVEG